MTALIAIATTHVPLHLILGGTAGRTGTLGKETKKGRHKQGRCKTKSYVGQGIVTKQQGPTDAKTTVRMNGIKHVVLVVIVVVVGLFHNNARFIK